MKEVVMRAAYAISLIILFVYFFFPDSPAYAQPVPEVSESLVDIGVTPKSISRTKPFYVRNVGDATLIISNVIMSNAINFSASPTVFAVEPGDSGQVDVTLTPWWELGIFTTTITVVSFNAQPDSIHLEAIGEGILDSPLISVTPMALSAYLADGEQSIQQLRVQNIGSETLDWSKSSSDPVVRVTGSTIDLDPLAWRDMEVIFPYTPVPPGVYHYTITFTSNDPYNPTFIVPVDLHIPGLPATAVDPDSIDFGIIYFGYPSDRTFSVTNMGTGILHVSNITSNNGDYTVAPKVFELAYLASQDVTVTCDPTVAGINEGILTIVSDDEANPNVDVYVTATASDLTPPLLSAPQDTIEVTLPPGARTNRMVVISNLGQGDLNWSASIKPTSTELILDGMKVMVDDSKGYSNFFYGEAAGFIVAMTGLGASFAQNTNHLITPQMLALYDAVIIPYKIFSSGGGYAQSELDAFHDFVLDGGNLMIHGYAAARRVSMNSLLSSLGSGISFVGDNYTANPWVIDFTSCEFTAGIDSIYQTGDNAGINVEPPGIVFANNEQQIHAAYFENEGRVFVMANKVYRDSDVGVAGADNLQLLLQMFTWLNKKSPGRSVTPESGVVPGESTGKLCIFFETVDLEEGTYGADIVLTHDGPGAVPVHVPTILIIDSTVTAIDDRVLRRDVVLYQNHPNPFNPATDIGFELDKGGPATLRIYDVSGRLVRTLVHRHMVSGFHSKQWDGRDAKGRSVASGVYFYQLQAGGKKLTKKMILLK
jgi:hypothetical protein